MALTLCFKLTVFYINYSILLYVCLVPGPAWYIWLWHRLAQYNLFVVKVPLSTNKPHQASYKICCCSSCMPFSRKLVMLPIAYNGLCSFTEKMTICSLGSNSEVTVRHLVGYYMLINRNHFCKWYLFYIDLTPLSWFVREHNEHGCDQW